MIEMEFGKAIIKEINKIDKITKEILIPELDRLTGHKQARFDDQFKNLVGIALVAALIARMKSMFYGESVHPDTEPRQELFKRSINRMTKPFLERVKDKTEKEFVNEFERQTGTKPLQNQLNVDEFIEESLARNVNLIKKIPAKHFSDISDLTEEAVRKGELTPVLQKKIRELSQVSKNRARLIARDQVAKLMGNIEEARQRKLGVKEYIWRTRQDVRVRSFANTKGTSDHKRLEGEIQKWKEPPVTVFRGKRVGERHHPSTDIQCFPKGTMISTENGQKPIEEIKIGDSVHSHWGMQKVVELHKNHYEGDLIGIKFPHKTIWLTPGHKVLLKGHEGDSSWVAAHHLKIGDKLVKLEKLFTGNFFHKEIARNIKHPHPHLISEELMSIGVDITHTGLNFYNCIKFIKFKISLVVNSIFAVRFFKNPLRSIFDTKDIKPSSTYNLRFRNGTINPISTLWTGGSWKGVFSSFRIFNPLGYYRLASMPDLNTIMSKDSFNHATGHPRDFVNVPVRPKLINVFFSNPRFQILTDFFLGNIKMIKEITLISAFLRTINTAFVFKLTFDNLERLAACFAVNIERSSLHKISSKLINKIRNKQLHCNIVDVVSQSFNGDVYNFGVDKSMSYFAEGVLVENCRCWPQPIYDEITGVDHPDTVAARKKAA